MPGITRRNCIRGTLAGLAAASPSLGIPHSPSRTGFKLSELFGDPKSVDVTIARQIGVTHVITGMGFGRVRKEEYLEQARKTKEAWAAVGMTIAGVEGHPVPFENLKAGTPQAGEEIENTKWAIEALARIGVDMICYNFMAGRGWTRTNTKVPERGGALTSEFDATAPEMRQLTRFGEISEEKMWANITRFLKEVIPVADKFKVKMALHPDDPPLSPLSGVARICTSARNYRRIMDIVPSPMNGVTFCQANFKLMGEDIYALAKEFTSKKKVFFVHFRDVEGTKTKFHETFHDNGPTDMVRMLKIYSDAGFDGPIRPDHAPAIASDNVGDRGSSGYTMGAKVLAFGYMRGIMEALRLPYA
ncbi:MAG TPA: mannonate dehydratase [Bryobacteraceae bacterium]|nr:mannonate dehydratase [Bryobacteraceae bacterium]